MKNSFLQSAATHGLFIGLALIILALLDWRLGYYGQNTAFSLLSYTVWIGGLVWSAIVYRKQAGGYISYGQAFGFSITVAAVYAILGALFSLLLIYVIDPGYMETVLALTEEALLNAGMPQAQVDMALEVSSKLSHPVLHFLSSIFSTLLISAIIALITSAIVRKVNPNPFTGNGNL
ncbi:MAG: DUF4199 domain-containing protein [Prevotellaceae bacterium]|jgi:uncharacterized membrane protein|nr:DUF4199 domain-containing protein [Prevotellaceae bacterium]